MKFPFHTLFGAARATGLMVFAVSIGHSQSASRSAPPPDETILLPEFSIEAEAESGFTAANSVSATRIATELKKLPVSIDIITELDANVGFRSQSKAFETTDPFLPDPRLVVNARAGCSAQLLGKSVSFYLLVSNLLGERHCPNSLAWADPASTRFSVGYRFKSDDPYNHC